MSDVTTTAPAVQSRAPAAPAFAGEREVARLRSTIESMDCMAQEALGQIAAIAKLALLAMEQPGRTAIRDEMIAKALEAIWAKAECSEDSINATAEEVGCNSHDEAFERRMAATG